MFTVDVPKLLVSFLTFYTISSVLYDINTSVIRATADLLSAAFIDKAGEERRKERRIQEEMRRIEEEEEEEEEEMRRKEKSI